MIGLYDNVYVLENTTVPLRLELRLVGAFVKAGDNIPKEYEGYDRMIFKRYTYCYRPKPKKKFDLIFDNTLRFIDIMNLLKDNIVKNKKRGHFIRIYNSNKKLIDTKNLLIEEINKFNESLTVEEPRSKRKPSLFKSENADSGCLKLTCYLFNKTVCSKLLPFIDHGEERELAESFLKNDSPKVADNSNNMKQQQPHIDYSVHDNNNNNYSIPQNLNIIPELYQNDTQMLSMTNNVNMLCNGNTNEIQYYNNMSTNDFVTNYNLIDNTSMQNCNSNNTTTTNNFNENSIILEPDKTITSIPNFELGDSSLFRDNTNDITSLGADQHFNSISMDSNVNVPVVVSEDTISTSAFQDVSSFRRVECSNDSNPVCLNQQIDNFLSNGNTNFVNTNENNRNDIVHHEEGKVTTINVPIEMYTPVVNFIEMLKNQKYKHCDNCNCTTSCFKCPLCANPLTANQTM